MKYAINKARLALLAGAALFCTGAWSAPLTDEAAHTRTETVKYAPSRAASAEGAAALYDQLRAAAGRVCGDPQTQAVKPGIPDADYASCVKDALDTAVRHIGIPMVSVLHQNSSERRSAAVVRR